MLEVGIARFECLGILVRMGGRSHLENYPSSALLFCRPLNS